MSIGKQVTILSEFNYDEVDITVLGVYSTAESAKINAQIHINNRTDRARLRRIELEWSSTADTAWAELRSYEIEYRVQTVILDAAIPVEEL